MEEKNLHIEDLIARFLAGEANHSELQQLEKWKAESSDNYLLFRDYKKLWDQSAKIKDIFEPDLNAEWNKLSSKIDFSEKYQNKNKGKFWTPVKIAASFVVIAVAAFLAYYILDITKSQTNSKFANVEKGPKEILLADGSKITLNKNSILEYPDKFDDDIRAVNLKGEAYLEISKNPNKPFVVQSGDLRIQVLGTSFYVNSDEDENFTLVVKEGQVSLYHKNDEKNKQLVGPNEMAFYNKKNGTINLSNIEDDNYLAWKTKKMVFSDKKLSKVIKTINKAYDCEIVIENKNTNDCRLTTSFDNTPLETVLNLLKANFDFEIQKSGQKIILKGGGC
ncbi:MAG: FecR domain-containing protein [Bacteroidales bacterium]|nr:FecR domain-containing protein [Bacteroidales bacterium]